MFSKITLVLLPLVFSLEAQTRDKNHNDAFVQGAPDETSIAREVRHQLVTLPYYGVFDDLAFYFEQRIRSRRPRIGRGGRRERFGLDC